MSLVHKLNPKEKKKKELIAKDLSYFPTKPVKIVYKWLSYDTEIDPDKYYICSYGRNLPTCSMVGWYKVSNVRKILKMTYGEIYKNYLYWIKGSELIDKLGEIIIFPGVVFINDKRRRISHFPIWGVYQVEYSFVVVNYLLELILMEKKDKLKAEEELVTRLKYQFYAERKGKGISKDISAKRSNLSKVAKTIQKRKRTLYGDEGK